MVQAHSKRPWIFMTLVTQCMNRSLFLRLCWRLRDKLGVVHVEAHEKMQQVHRKGVAPWKDSEVLRA